MPGAAAVSCDRRWPPCSAGRGSEYRAADGRSSADEVVSSTSPPFGAVSCRWRAQLDGADLDHRERLRHHTRQGLLQAAARTVAPDVVNTIRRAAKTSATRDEAVAGGPGGRALCHASGALRYWRRDAARWLGDTGSRQCRLDPSCLNLRLPDRYPYPRRGSACVWVVGLLERRDRDLGTAEQPPADHEHAAPRHGPGDIGEHDFGREDHLDDR